MSAYLLDPLLPWDILPEEKSRSKKITSVIFLICLVITFVVPFLPLPEEDRSQQETLPPRLAKLVMKKKAIKKPPPPKQEKKKQEKKKEDKKEEIKPEKKEEKPPKEARRKAREVAKKYIAVFDALADLRDTNLPIFRPKKLKKGSGKEAIKADRSIVTSAASSRSGGIVTAKASIGSGSQSLERVETTQVESKLAEVQRAEQEQRSIKGKIAQRTSEDIEYVIQQNKGAIYGIYNRFLRRDPNLEGTVVLHMIIAPDGTVTLCEVISSDLENTSMERKLIARIRLINFGANNVGIWDSTYPITFIPS